MSYAGTVCRCGGKKAADTLICVPCEQSASDNPSLAVYRDHAADLEQRQHAAFILLSLAASRGAAKYAQANRRNLHDRMA